MISFNIKILTGNDLHPTLLAEFQRHQETKWVRNGDCYTDTFKEDHFIEDWDDLKKQEVIRALGECIRSGGVVVGAYCEGELVGFASLGSQFFGPNKEYLELGFIHVSNPFRKRGIGLQLFKSCCDIAREKGATKLYLGAHPALETQYFYDAMGCVPAAYINPEIYNREPRDIQLEVAL